MRLVSGYRILERADYPAQPVVLLTMYFHLNNACELLQSYHYCSEGITTRQRKFWPQLSCCSQFWYTVGNSLPVFTRLSRLAVIQFENHINGFVPHSVVIAIIGENQMGYELDASGIHRDPGFAGHRNHEYDEHAFKLLSNMQSGHFWYKGRHKFILNAVKYWTGASTLSAIDFGGGVGGWVKFLHDSKMRGRIAELAMADSSEVALNGARNILAPSVDLYQVDLMNIGWENRWDVAFLLDVIEHCPDDREIIRQAAKALKPGGKLIVTTPALDCFWSHNDVIAQHLRRYNKEKYEALARDAGLVLRANRYFMFYLSPLYWLSRKTKSADMSEEKLMRAVEKEHQIPNRIVNSILTAIFEAESTVGHKINFPWGTSILGVFEKPENPAH